jgi:maltoporin
MIRGWALVVVCALAAGEARAQLPLLAPPARESATGKYEHEVGSPPPPADTGNGFAFGSYGRIGVGIDGSGHEGYPTNVVSHGSRLEELPYIELDLYYGGQVLGGRWRAVIAPAFGGDLFHYTGDFSSHFALRNGYVETEDIGVRGLHLWAGSRMYRGDDVYLFDYWPLDNLNTVGGGASLRRGDNDIAIQAGQNVLKDPFQIQTQLAPAHGVGPPIPALVLDRPRTIASAKYTRYLHSSRFPTAGAKVSLYGEFHFLPEGDRPIPTEDRVEHLPSDFGWVAGAQLGLWSRAYTFLNLFFRYAGGLAAYGDLTNPQALAPDKRAVGARELVFAISHNLESRRVGVMSGFYVRRFVDPAPDPFNPRSYVEYIAAARPQLYITRWLNAAVEVSAQGRFYDGVDAYLDRRLNPQVYRLSFLPIVSPLGPGTYARPIIYGVYTLSILNQDARDALFDPTDVRYSASVVHYLGIGAEWWFQSSYR